MKKITKNNSKVRIRGKVFIYSSRTEFLGGGGGGCPGGFHEVLIQISLFTHPITMNPIRSVPTTQYVFAPLYQMVRKSNPAEFMLVCFICKRRNPIQNALKACEWYNFCNSADYNLELVYTISDYFSYRIIFMNLL